MLAAEAFLPGYPALSGIIIATFETGKTFDSRWVEVDKGAHPALPQVAQQPHDWPQSTNTVRKPEDPGFREVVESVQTAENYPKCQKCVITNRS